MASLQRLRGKDSRELTPRPDRGGQEASASWLALFVSFSTKRRAENSHHGKFCQRRYPWLIPRDACLQNCDCDAVSAAANAGDQGVVTLGNMRRACRLYGKFWLNKAVAIDSGWRGAWSTESVGASPGSREVAHATDDVDLVVHPGTGLPGARIGTITQFRQEQICIWFTILAAVRDRTGLPLPKSTQDPCSCRSGTDGGCSVLDRNMAGWHASISGADHWECGRS